LASIVGTAVSNLLVDNGFTIAPASISTLDRYSAAQSG
jgi:hypothetical protein